MRHNQFAKDTKSSKVKNRDAVSSKMEENDQELEIEKEPSGVIKQSVRLQLT